MSPRANAFWQFVVIVGALTGALALSFALAFLGIDPLIILVGGVGVVAAVLGLRFVDNSRALLGALLAAGFLGAFALPTGTESKIPISLVLVLMIVLVWVLQIITRQAPKPLLRPSPINWYVGIYVAANLFSFVWSTLLRDPLVYVTTSFFLVQGAALLVNCLLPLILLVVLNKVDSIDFWKKAVWIVILIGMIGVWQRILSLPLTAITDNGLRGLTAMWAGGFAFVILIYRWKIPLYAQALAALTFGGFLWYNLHMNTVWLSGWLPLVIMCAVATWFRSRRLFVLFALVGVAFMAMNFDVIYANVVQSNLDEGSGSRLDLWQVALDHVMRHPLFGSGPAGYAAYYMTYNPLDARSTHNNYFDVLAQNGVVGLLLFVALVVRLGIMGLKNIAASNRQEDLFVRILATGSLAGLVGGLSAMMLGDWVLPFAYNQTILGFDNALFTWIFWGSIVSLYWLNSRLENPAPDTTGLAAVNPEP